MKKLKERIIEYQSVSDSKLLPKLPVIICINGNGFTKTTQFLTKPYCDKFDECMLSTMLRLCSYVEGTFFSYQHNDEIVLISRNDQSLDTNLWYNGNVQKICSIVSSAATLYFNEAISALNLNMTGDVLFTTNIFTVPNQTEAINTIIYHQQQNLFTSIQSACLYNLLNKYDKNIIKDMLNGLNIDEKISLLNQECEINFNDYPLAFRRGSAAYKKSTIIDEIIKNKWVIDSELPLFTRNQSFLNNIFKLGEVF
jgi:tRNA(His) 5'-end guanylyltransferase